MRRQAENVDGVHITNGPRAVSPDRVAECVAQLKLLQESKPSVITDMEFRAALDEVSIGIMCDFLNCKHSK